MNSLSLMQDVEHYRRCFGIFQKRIQKGETLTEWLYSNLLDNIRSKVTSSVECSNKVTLRALGVGSGAGKYK